MSRITHIIFDLDGTLIDSSEGVVAAINHALTKAGDELPPPEKIKSFIGYSLQETFPHFSDKPYAVLRAYFQEKSNDLVVGATTALPGATEALEELKRRGYKLSIATTKVVQNIEGILRKLQWENYFDVFTGGDEVMNVKPDPEAFGLTLKRMGAGVEESVVIGDTINDVLAAKALGLPVIAVASPFEAREKVIAARPDYFVESIMGVIDLIEEIGQGRKDKR